MIELDCRAVQFLKPRLCVVLDCRHSQAKQGWYSHTKCAMRGEIWLVFHLVLTDDFQAKNESSVSSNVISVLWFCSETARPRPLHSSRRCSIQIEDKLRAWLRTALILVSFAAAGEGGATSCSTSPNDCSGCCTSDRTI